MTCQHRVCALIPPPPAVMPMSRPRDCCNWVTARIIVPTCRNSKWCLPLWTPWACLWPANSLRANKPMNPCMRHQAQHAVQEMTTRRQGKTRLKERPAVEEAIAVLLTRFRVEGLLCVEIQEHVQERPVRAYRGHVSSGRRDVTFTITCEREEKAI